MTGAGRSDDAAFHAKAMAVLGQALQHPAAQRDAWVREVCAGDAALRDEVLSLLEHEASVDDLAPGGGARLLRDLGAPAATGDAGDAAAGRPGELAPGAVIDRYRLLQRIGEGGFGTVWMAEQLRPVKRKVALKVIKLGMDTKAVVARFEAERQALAMMDHPHIAKVLDGGATESGRPYFVMELVKGVPITTYCDEARLDLRQRLRLFTGVCHALQHAHGKGVIHRDVKPSNVLVTLLDGAPVPKVIDFGVAKATSAELTQRTLFTEFQQMVGTPEYMAPEQTALSALDVDTRSDVYSLGVLLYELLTGTRPFDLKTAMAKGYDEVLRTIREEEPVKPSTRVSTLGDTGTRAASLRLAGAGELSSALRGDLDWIVLKALEKDRARRYDTAAGLAADVERYLADEPVAASPPSRAYQLRKFVRRHRGAVTAAAALLLVLVLGLAGTLWGWAASLDANAALSDALDDVREQREAADASAQAAQEAQAAAEAETARAEAELRRATEIKQLVIGMVTSLDPVIVGQADTVLLRGILDRTARRLDEGTVSDPLVRAELHLVVADAYRSLGVLAPAVAQARSGWTLRAEALGEQHPDTMAALAGHARALWGQGDYATLAPLYERYLAFCRDAHGDRDLRTAMAAQALGNAYTNLKRRPEAQPLLEEAHAFVRAFPPADPHRVQVTWCLALNLIELERLEEARALLEGSLAALEPLTGVDLAPVPANFDPLAPSRSPRVQFLITLKVEGQLLMAEGRYTDAIANLRRSLAGLEELLGSTHHRVQRSRDLLITTFCMEGRWDEALELGRAQYEAALAVCEPSDRQLAKARGRLLWVLAGKSDEAEYLEEMEALWPEQWRQVEPLAPDDMLWSETMTSGFRMLTSAGRHEEAAAFIEACSARELAWQEATGERAPWRFQTLMQLGRSRAHFGHEEEALALSEERLVLAQEHEGPSGFNTLFARLDLAKQLDAMGRDDEALEQLRLVVQACVQSGFAPQSPVWAHARDELYTIHTRRGAEDELLRDVVWPFYRAIVAQWERGELPEDWTPLTAAEANAIAWRALRHEDPALRDPDMALRLARWMITLEGGRQPGYLDTYALALFTNGDVEEALSVQREAVALLPEGPLPLRAELEARLAEFEAAAERMTSEADAGS